MATYTCESGYILPDSQMNKKQCQAGAEAWSAGEVVCNIKGDIFIYAHVFNKGCGTLTTIIGTLKTRTVEGQTKARKQFII